jgi:O-methyltransferase involved in polyketide biosynthesis
MEKMEPSDLPRRPRDDTNGESIGHIVTPGVVRSTPPDELLEDEPTAPDAGGEPQDWQPEQEVRIPPSPDPAQEKSLPSHDRIAVTAINNAKLMVHTGIPLYREIAETAQRLWEAGGHEVQPAEIQPAVNAPGIEVRYRLGNQLTQDSPQVLDVAAGLTPRGLTMTTENPDKVYVEMDLPVMAQLKTEVIADLERQGLASKPDNLHIEPGNALDTDSMLNAARHFDSAKPVTVTSEGLLHYLPHSEKAVMAENVRTVLERHGPGSTWYTDMPVQQGITGQDSAMARTTSQQTGRSIAANRFATPEEAKTFFAAHGLEVKRLYPYSDPALINSLTSPAAVGTTLEQVTAENRPWSMYAMEVGLLNVPPRVTPDL